VFSLAVIAFELLTGRRPSGVGDHMGPLTGATLGTHADAIREVLVKAMQENPADRYASAGAFATALTQAAGVETSDQAAAAASEPIVSQPVEPVVAPLPIVVTSRPVDAEPGLEDFAAEPVEQLPGESAREVARKVIAARKRQTREREQEKAQKRELEPLLTEEPAAVEIVPEPTVSEPIVVETIPDPPVSEPLVLEPAVSEPVAVREEEEPPVPAELPSFEQPAAAASIGIREIGPREAEPAMRETSDRVVAVDEFRLRDVTPLRPERPRHRPQDRIVPERTIVPASTPVESVLDRVDTDVHHVPHEDSHSDRARIAMLPLAMMLIPGLVLGYIAGYVVGSRDSRAEQSAVGQTAPPATAPGGLTTPGTSGQTPPPKDFSEAAVAPKPPSEPAAERKPAAATAPSPTPKTGQLVVTSTPAKAAVTVNGEWSGRTPLTLNRPFGTYNVRVVQNGYEIERERVQLSANAPKKTIDVTLRPSRAAAGTASPAPASAAAKPSPAAAKPTPPPAAVTTGEIFVDSRPQGARVLIDGKLQGVTPLRLTNQAAGSYAVRLELTDHQPWTVTTRVTPGSVARVTGSLERIR
jgi:hypothetical protein